jgi:hypothetical protein
MASMEGIGLPSLGAFRAPAEARIWSLTGAVDSADRAGYGRRGRVGQVFGVGGRCSRAECTIIRP